MEKKFSIEEAISAGWEILKNNFWFILGLQMIVFALNLFPELADFVFEDFSSMEIPLLMIGVGFFILQIIVNIGMIKIFLGLHDKKQERNVGDLFSGVDHFLDYIIGGIVYVVIVAVGFILLIVPGIIWSIKYQFFAYLIIDKNMGPLEALKESARMTKGQKMNLFIFSLVAILLNLAGLLFVGIGLLVTVPLTSLAVVYIFRKLSAEANVPVQAAPGVIQSQVN
ncbi:MAG: hypothetical protein ACD_15C00027G0005 [uncultured bacterium]|nr:MAG: hypothetical protein ACD_15C00027G0005 [uncultured bacterium]HCU70288.1 hypothetical protein [Candidatus Moranbacteria bacterium]